nr:response regulator [Candidatus Sigynarchaeota archaeon]
MAGKQAILDVDDDAGFRDSMTAILDDMDFLVTMANDGYEAVEKMYHGNYDVILLDFKMPGINGVETFHRISDYSRYQRSFS